MGGMKPATKEAWRRFAIVAIVWFSTGALWTLIGVLAKPTIDANPKSVVGALVLLLGVAMFAFWLWIYRLVYRRLRSECPKCHQLSAKMVTKPSQDIYLECERCGYSEPTGWDTRPQAG
jgi:hypothetical protein